MFKDHRDAGRKLADRLSVSGEEYVVFGIPRGGVIAAKEIADRFDFDLRVLVSRELHDSIQTETVIGAVSPDRSYALDRDIVERFGLKEDYIDRIVRIESIEIDRRMMKYTGSRDFESVEGKNAILVGEGILSKYLMGVCVKYLRSMGAEKVVVAVPVVSKSLIESFENSCDGFVFLESADGLEDVSEVYRKYNVTEDDVMSALGR